jgi:hypothetical protein
MVSKFESNTVCMQPAKRRATVPAEASTSKVKQSKLAKEHGITGIEEQEIKEAFELFAKKMKGEQERVIPIGDVRRAMMYFHRSCFAIHPQYLRVHANLVMYKALKVSLLLLTN